MSHKPEVVVITGASADLGRATARAFARRSAHIGLLARGRDGLEAVSREVDALEMGSPEYLSAWEVEQLQDSSQLL